MFKAALFFITFFHPGVSVAMFETFNCIDIRGEGDVVEYYLKNDRAERCFQYHDPPPPLQATWWSTTSRTTARSAASRGSGGGTPRCRRR
mmetsp:Transcript_49806/g.159164  ORF Transcript_49806/g.159164 Transcript_49806/m.159164 type:complete len:90 (+) Transcript_49806:828-1097(+)